MIIEPATVALIGASGMSTAVLGYAAWFAGGLLRRWDLSSGSQEQLRLERQTYLISTALLYVCLFQVLSLLLFIHTADRMHLLFSGAMCAAGTLNVNAYGYPALGAMTLSAMASALWLIINHADSRSPYYPLIRLKYALVMVLLPMAAASLILEWAYFAGLDAEVITSCCGSLFSSSGATGAELEAAGLWGALRAIDARGAAWGLYMGTALLIVSGGIYIIKSGRVLGGVYAMLSGLMVPVAVGAMVAYVSPYVYELPTHRCPFCLVQSDYHYIGYLYYALVFLGGVAGMGGGLMGVLGKREGLQRVALTMGRRLTVVSIASYAAYAALAGYAVLSSNLEGAL